MTHADFAFGTGAFTLEAWLFRLSSGNPSGFGTYPDWSQASSGAGVYFETTGDVLGRVGKTDGADVLSGGVVPLNEWHHVAFTRDGSNVTRLFLDGVLKQQGTSTRDCQMDNLSIGRAVATTSGNYFHGYMNGVRVSKGVARYTANFTPQATPFIYVPPNPNSTGSTGGPNVLSKPTARIVTDSAYVYTFVTDWGEESAPSPVSDLLTTDQNDSATITRTNTLPTGRGTITHWRLYRTNSGSASTEFQFVAEIPIATTSYTDTVPADKLGEVLPTLYWLTPPENMRGITAMANGVHAGFFENTLCFCEPYHPYAWPISYQLTVKNPIVGIAAFGQNLFVGTRGAPYIVSGADSASMSMLELPGGQPCVSARSIVATDYGAIYASPDGLCLATSNGVEVITAGLFAREDWQELNPDDTFAAMHDSVYYFAGWNQGATFLLLCTGLCSKEAHPRRVGFCHVGLLLRQGDRCAVRGAGRSHSFIV